MTTIENINSSIAKYFCGIIHNELVGAVPADANNGYAVYKNKLDSYRLNIQNRDHVEFFVNELKKIWKIYTKDTGDIITYDNLVTFFVEHYSFRRVYETLDGPKKIIIMMSIMGNVLESYIKFITISDTYAYFRVILSAEQKASLLAKMKQKIHHTAAIAQFSVCSDKSKTVPKSMFTKLRKKYEELLNS